MRHLIRTGTERIPDAELRRIAIPIALLWGRHDRFVPLGLAADASARLGWPLHVIDDAGHVPHIERTDAFLDAPCRVARRASARPDRGEGGTMSTRSIYEMAEAIAPGWERWRARIEDIVSPVRGWMLAGAGTAARRHGARARGRRGRHRLRGGCGRRRARPAHLDRLLAGDAGRRPPPRRRARARERGLPADGRRADRARRRRGRRRALPVRVHADARPGRGARRDAPCAAPGRAPRAGGVGRARAQPVDHDRLRAAGRARSPAATRPRRPGPVRDGGRGGHAGVARGRRLPVGANRGDPGSLRLPRPR